MSQLARFYSNVEMREEVHDYLIKALGEHAKHLAFTGESTHGIQEAAIAIDQAFTMLDIQFGKQKVKAPVQASK